MIQSAFARACIALGTFWVGLHLMGLALWQNSNTGPGNVVWGLFQFIWTIEVIALKSALFLLVAVILMFVISELTGWAFRDRRKSVSVNHPKNSAEPVPATGKIMNPQPKRDEAVIKKVVDAPSVKAQPPPLTAADLKRRALKQITGKEYLK